MILEIIAVFAVVQTLSIFVLKTILENTIKFEFKKREQATMIAALFAEWINKSPDYKTLNRLAWEANLWLPDELAKEVNKRLANDPTAKDVRVILVAIKEFIQGKKSDLDFSTITFYK